LEPEVELFFKYIDTCFQDYLTDHHNRPGELLVGVRLGVQVDEFLETVCKHIQEAAEDGFLPQNEIPKAALERLREIVEKLDLRPVDELGNRVSEVGEPGDQPYVWILASWKLNHWT
jgi:hypothetical protein